VQPYLLTHNWTGKKTGEPARLCLKTVYGLLAQNSKAMKDTPPHLRVLEEIEQAGIPAC
jgi:hypothetical protein